MAKRDIERRNRGEVRATFSTSYQGLLPPPNMLEHYDRILPGGIQWLLDETQRQIRHRQALESKKLDSDLRKETRGQWFAFIITLSVVGIGGFLISSGRATAAGVGLIATNLVALAAVFLKGRKNIEVELARKRQAMEELERS